MLAYCPNCLETIHDEELVACRRCGKAQPTGGVWPRDLYLGQTVDNGKYLVERIIGSGGFGKVYRVSHTMLQGRAFAMKVLSGSMVGDQEREGEFLQEVQILLGLDHPNIVRCHDVGRLQTGALFIRMELVEGEGIHAAILPPTQLMSPERVAYVALQGASALAAAHKLNVLHRDLKPANILRLRGDEIRIIDFGIAKVLEQGVDSGLSRVIGTPDYMAPEQFQPGTPLDGRLDIYQLGAVLHYLLTGKAPYASARVGNTHRALLETARQQEARADTHGPRPSESLPALAQQAPELDAIIGDMLSTRVERRPTAEALVGLLTPLVEANPPPAAHTGSYGRSAVAPTSPSEELRTQVMGRASTPTPTPLKPASTGALDKPVAVLPLRNLGPDEDAYLAEGLTEDLADALTMLPGVLVRPLGRVASALNTTDDPQELGQLLGVHFIVDGSARRMGEKIQVRMRLYSVKTGFQLWAQRFACSLDELLNSCDIVTTAISQALATDAAPPKRKTGPSAHAVDLFLKARHLLRHRWHGDIQEAIVLLDEALDEAPEDPQILALNAVARARRAFRGTPDEDMQLSLAHQYAHHACALSPERPEPHFAMGLVLRVEGDDEAAAASLQQALACASAHAPSHDLLGRILLDHGPIDAAERHLRHALGLDPSLFNTRLDLARCHALQRQWDRARGLLVTDQEQDPIDRGLSDLLRVRFALWRRAPEDEDIVPPPASAEGPVHGMLSLLCEVRRTGTFTPQQRAWIQHHADTSGNPKMRTLYHQYMAEVAAWVGDRALCLHTLEVALFSGLTDIVWLHRCPLFDALADHPALIALRNQHPERAAQPVLAR